MLMNLLALFGAALAGMILGVAWYSKMLFGKQWMALSGAKEEKILKNKQSAINKTYFLGFLMLLLEAFVLRLFIVFIDVQSLHQAAALGFWAWLGFVVPSLMNNVLYEQKSFKLFVLNAGYQLVAIVLMAVVIAALV